MESVLDWYRRKTAEHAERRVKILKPSRKAARTREQARERFATVLRELRALAEAPPP
jgi:hypothetical protein